MFPSSTRKALPRTYSRAKRPVHDEEPPPKRRRVAQRQTAEDDGETTRASSSPARAASAPGLSSSPQPTFSSEADAPARATPPSSPPPAPATERSSPPPPELDVSAKAPRRPVFALFARHAQRQHRASAPAVLSSPSQTHNAAKPPPPPPQPKKPRLVQMQLDLAAAQRKTCSCGMEYIPSNAADAALHKKFHAVNAGGVDCTRAMVERLRGKQVWSGGEEGGFIACVGRRDALGLRRKASEVLSVVNKELAAVPIEDGELWGKMALGAESCDRFKVYLYVRGQKCVGACLAERVSEGYAVLAQGDEAADSLQEQEQKKTQGPAASSSRSSSISVSTTPAAALLGISRIWVSSQSRRRGLARRLLDTARGTFLYGLTVEKRRMAFSQPTESGGKLARRYFGCEAGWLVYME